jgi:hypothetical protein
VAEAICCVSTAASRDDVASSWPAGIVESAAYSARGVHVSRPSRIAE